MFQDLFVNACILIAIIFVASQMFRNTGLSTTSSTQVKVILGLMGGITSSILIHFSIDITSEIVLDLREICFIIVAMFGGWFPALITGLVSAAFRLSYHSINTLSLVFAIEIIIACLGCGLISYMKFSTRTKCSVMLLYTLICRSVVYYLVMENKSDAIKVIFSNWGYSIIVGIGILYLVQYLVTTHQVLKTLKKASTVDYLTGLSNYRQFDTKYKLILEQTAEVKSRLALLIIDIDYFKNVNDTFGHAAGDVVLKELGKLLKSSCKEYYLVSRIGGEEFAVIMKDKSKEEVVAIAENLRSMVKAHQFILPDNKKLKLSISIGAAVYPDTLDNINKLKEEADTKLYEAKRTGRNRVCI